MTKQKSAARTKLEESKQEIVERFLDKLEMTKNFYVHKRKCHSEGGNLLPTEESVLLTEF